ncbi:MAG: tetratricopeptide repeat protein [Bacteroidia bacterium]|nr:tetratricopeptide repeat protein [Bacteroidia bacterium]
MRFVRIFLVLVFGLLLYRSPAQKTAHYALSDPDFRDARELFEQGKFGPAQHMFNASAARYSDPNNLVRTEAEFFAAVCAVELFNKDAEWLLEEFISRHPESPRRTEACFHLGRYNFRKKKYTDVIHWLAQVNPDDLSPEETEEYLFKKGYSHLECGEPEKAVLLLADLAGKESRYGPPANYYYSHILYTQKNYQSALMGFRKLTSDPNFGPIVPYYISHILFLQGKYDEVVVYAPPLLKDTLNASRTPEINKILGESFFRTGDYQEAAPYLEKYMNLTGVLSRSEWYQLGFCYYKSLRFTEAITAFLKSVDQQDSVTQNACYHLGDCYVKINDKKKAADAFLIAYTSGNDIKIREDALFNYAKLSFETDYNPFNESIRAFEEYLAEYPNSGRRDEVFGYLVNVYYNLRNYESAIKSMENIKSLPPDLKNVYQKIAYLRGVQLYNDQNYSAAADHFSKSLQYPADRNYAALARYWKANATYQMGELSRNTSMLDDAIKQFREFLFENGAGNTPYFNVVNYDLGYCFLRKSDFDNALLSFRKYLTGKPSGENARLNDAYLRTADCYFKKGEHVQAADYYGRSLEMNIAEMDYALYQRGLSLGFSGKGDMKVQELNKLLEQYPGSVYEAAGMYELAKAYTLKDEYEKAYKLFVDITQKHPVSSYVPPSMLQAGNILFKQRQYDKALVQLETVISKFPKTEVAIEAIATMNEICKQKSDMDCLEKLGKIPWANISVSRLDSNAWELCRLAYEEKRMEDAKREMSKYLQKYPDGTFVMDAYFYRSEIEYSAGNFTAALGGYQFLSDHLPNKYGNTALHKAAWIQYKGENFQEALKFYSLLEQRTEQPGQMLDSRIGQMRCLFKLKYYGQAMEYAKKVLGSEKVPKEVIPECHMILAKSALDTQALDQAWISFQEVIKTSQGERVAEARYYLGYVKWLKGEFKESQKLLFELIQSKPAYGYWNGKAFLLISDDYVGLNDLHNAKITLKALIEKSTNPELVAEANTKLSKVLEMEKELEEKNKKKEGEGMRVLFGEQPSMPTPSDTIRKEQ